jgi:hypothetical protein
MLGRGRGFIYLLAKPNLDPLCRVLDRANLIVIETTAGEIQTEFAVIGSSVVAFASDSVYY